MASKVSKKSSTKNAKKTGAKSSKTGKVSKSKPVSGKGSKGSKGKKSSTTVATPATATTKAVTSKSVPANRSKDAWAVAAGYKQIVLWGPVELRDATAALAKKLGMSAAAWRRGVLQDALNVGKAPKSVDEERPTKATKSAKSASKPAASPKSAAEKAGKGEKKTQKPAKVAKSKGKTKVVTSGKGKKAGKAVVDDIDDVELDEQGDDYGTGSDVDDTLFS